VTRVSVKGQMLGRGADVLHSPGTHGDLMRSAAGWAIIEATKEDCKSRCEAR